ncbi:putative Zinc finger protein 76 [Blattamonas nauphoetae]|uniref:Zinc finger protein 76 n=1 Tax=Blattamonas nauphoetae TaxID=2049346 RepID=A0ABQ9X9W1_9EUKA|nr:putative Zinc finger protein 76 [Blattamonas nauphoetae]
MSVFQCSICSRKFNRELKLTYHLRTHDGLRPYVCPHEDCGKSYKNQFHLRRHITRVHQTGKEFVCHYPDCGSSYKSADALKKHMKVHDLEYPYKCDVCGKGYFKPSQLENHKATHTGGFICDYQGCQAKPFTSAFTLLRHIETKHKSQKTYLCSVPFCGAVFSQMTDLQQHKREVHGQLHKTKRLSADNSESEEEQTLARDTSDDDASDNGLSINPLSVKPLHPCPWPGCRHSFSSPSNLRTHLESVHLCLHPFVCLCSSCGYQSFKHKHTLRKHIQTQHTHTVKRATTPSTNRTSVIRSISISSPLPPSNASVQNIVVKPTTQHATPVDPPSLSNPLPHTLNQTDTIDFTEDTPVPEMSPTPLPPNYPFQSFTPVPSISPPPDVPIYPVSTASALTQALSLLASQSTKVIGNECQCVVREESKSITKSVFLVHVDPLNHATEEDKDSTILEGLPLPPPAFNPFTVRISVDCSTAILEQRLSRRDSTTPLVRVASIKRHRSTPFEDESAALAIPSPLLFDNLSEQPTNREEEIFRTSFLIPILNRQSGSLEDTTSPLVELILTPVPNANRTVFGSATPNIERLLLVHPTMGRRIIPDSDDSEDAEGHLDSLFKSDD